MDYDCKELSKRMIKYRTEHGLSMLNFAKLCKVSQPTICDVENCVRKPSKMTLQKILNVIGE